MAEYEETGGEIFCKKHGRYEKTYKRTEFRPDKDGTARPIVDYITQDQRDVERKIEESQAFERFRKNRR